jgi:hypothetical protein
MTLPVPLRPALPPLPTRLYVPVGVPTPWMSLSAVLAALRFSLMIVLVSVTFGLSMSERPPPKSPLFSAIVLLVIVRFAEL